MKSSCIESDTGGGTGGGTGAEKLFIEIVQQKF